MTKVNTGGQVIRSWTPDDVRDVRPSKAEEPSHPNFCSFTPYPLSFIRSKSYAGLNQVQGPKLVPEFSAPHEPRSTTTMPRETRPGTLPNGKPKLSTVHSGGLPTWVVVGALPTILETAGVAG